MIPVGGVSSGIHTDRGTHFTGQTVKEICKIWPIMQHFHCAYHPQSSGLVERTNGTIKIQLAKKQVSTVYHREVYSISYSNL